ncbi:MAG: hypothetical protein JWP44_4118, partial [Mucilaginibacter sp.]|nr:hypothetical protein [Mucilaginibacter sp.]
MLWLTSFHIRHPLHSRRRLIRELGIPSALPPIDKLVIVRLVLGWVTTGESLMLYVLFCL